MSEPRYFTGMEKGNFEDMPASAQDGEFRYAGLSID